MGKWQIIRWTFRAVATGLGAVAATTPPGILTMILIGLASGLGAVTLDMPRDPWPDELRRKGTKK